MKRKVLYELCGRLGLSTGLLMATRGFPARWLTVLAYHRVCEYDPHSPWDPDVISATPAAFRKQLAFIRTRFTPVTSEQVVDWRKGHFTMPRNPVVLTFDDGYLDNCQVALPLLLEAGVTADFFICTANVESRRPFWWDLIAYCLRRTGRKSIALSYPEQVVLNVESGEASRAARRTVLRIVKRTPELDIQAFVGELQAKSEVRLDEDGAAGELLMNWEHIRALQDAGMGVGSHTHTHPILPHAQGEAVREELTRSRRILEERLGRKVSTLAYPVGRFDDGVKVLAREAGYEIAYSYCSGASTLRALDMFHVRRVAVERDMSLPYFKTLVAAPFLA